MGLFHKQSRWEKMIGSVSHGAPKAVAKSGLTALAVAGVTLASAAVSAARQRSERQ